MGLLRKVLFVMTGGLSGLVFKGDSVKERTAPAPQKRVRAQKKPKATRAKAQAARQPRPQAARKAKKAGPRNATAKELERIAKLHRQGALTVAEFAAAKAKILGTGLPPQESSAEPPDYQTVEANVTAAHRLADLAGHDRSSSFATISSD